jgi:concanavalin A-like lectin/glucanase superfamily protein/List-Bact-rpt repeat protein
VAHDGTMQRGTVGALACVLALFAVVLFGTAAGAQTSSIVDFDNPAPTGTAGSLLNGLLAGIDFGNGQWRWEAAFGPDASNHIYFSSGTGTSRAFSFSPSPRVLNSLRVFSAVAGELTLTDDLGQTTTQSVLTGAVQLVTTGWTRESTTVTVSFTAGWALGVDDIFYGDAEPTAAAPGGSLRFHGNGIRAPNQDRVKIRIDNPAVPADVGATDFTLEFWMKALASENSAGPQSCGTNINWINGNIVFDRDRYNQDRKFGLSIAGGRFVFGVSGDGTGDRTICGVTNVLDNVWHHVAVQRRRSDGQMWLFVDGRLEAQAAGPGGDISYPNNATPGSFCGPGGSGSGSQPCTNDPFLVIGAEKHDAGAAYPSYSGFIDEVRLSGVLRYPSNGNFASPTQPFVSDAGTLALYHFDEGQGTTIVDSSGTPGGPSNGVRNVGGSPAGPEWVTETPFGSSPPAPSLSSLAPGTAIAGAPDFLLTVSGAAFVSGSSIQWNGASRATTFVSGTQLRATISASDVTAAGTAQVTVFTPPPGGGTSNALAFTIVPSFSVSVVRTGSGSGAVSSAPVGIDCGTVCSARFSADSTVVLTANPNPGSAFDGWSGCDVAADTQCTVRVTATKTVTAAFQAIPLRLTVTKAGTGNGLVASAAGIACGGVCTRVLNGGTALQLVATPDAGSTFVGWSGGGCSGAGPCSLTLTAVTTVTATFTAPLGQFALSVVLRGSADGAVSSDFSGIACGASCSQLYPSGTTVTLTATAAGGAAFKGWSGAGCSGSGSCTVAMTAPRAVQAIFSAVFASPNPVPGVSSPQVVDIVDLRSAITRLRAQNFGLPAWTFTDPAIVAGSTLVKAVHFAELRSALNDAYVQAGVALPGYSAPTLIPFATIIRATDLNELRSAVRTLE